MPSLTPGFSGPARINGKYGKGPNGYNILNAGKIQYVDPAILSAPANISASPNTKQYLIGNAPRTKPYGITGPANQTFNASVRRSFPIYHEMAFLIQADCSNVLNLMIWGGPSGGWGAGSSTFGTVGAPGTLPRDFQLSAHLSF
jgi:hypothetical protein